MDRVKLFLQAFKARVKNKIKRLIPTIFSFLNHIAWAFVAFSAVIVRKIAAAITATTIFRNYVKNNIRALLKLNVKNTGPTESRFLIAVNDIKEKYRKFTWRVSTYKKEMQFRFKELAWVKQLIDASQHGVHSTTLLATFGVNVLSLAFPLMLMQVYDRVITNRSYETMFFLSVGVVIALLLELALRVMRDYINLWSDTKYESALSRQAFGKLIDAPLFLYEQSGAGTRLKQLNTLDQMKGFYNNQLLSSIFDAPFVLLYLFVIAYIGGWLFLVPLLIILALTFCSFHFLQLWEPTLNQKLIHESRENNFIIDVLNNIHTVKALGMEALLIRRYERLQLSGIDVNYYSSVQTGDLLTMKTISSQVVVIFLVIFGSLYVMDGKMAIGGLAACSLLVGRIMQPLNRTLGAFNRWKMVNVVRQQLDAVLSLPTVDTVSSEGLSEFKGELSLQNVGFRYDEKSPWILRNINLTTAPGKIIGIIGREHSGKTTLVNIIATVLAPTEGKYLLDGHDVSQFRFSDLRKQIAYLSQTGKLFRGTVMENLSAFDKELVPTARRIAHALGLTQVISKLPNGFDTMVGDRAVDTFPNGVVKRIIMVRALAHKPRIILFDEANMNLDLLSDQQLMKILFSLKTYATIILVSQRDTTLALAEMLYELKNGQLTQVQQHDKA